MFELPNTKEKVFKVTYSYANEKLTQSVLSKLKAA
jgi:hypothetical protein